MVCDRIVRLCSAVLVFGFVVLAAFVARAETTGALGEDGFFRINVPYGETNTINEAMVTALGSAPLMKTGLGTLVCDATMEPFKGDVHIAEGTIKATHTKGLGTSNDGKICVSNNATLHIACNLAYNTAGGTYTARRFYLAGDGCNGMGALYCTSGCNLRYFTLEGDTTIRGTQILQFRQDGELHFGNHKLTTDFSEGQGVSFVCMTVKTAGTIDIKKGFLQIESMTGTWAGTKDNTLTVRSGAELRLRTCNGSVNSPWTLVLEDGAKFNDNLRDSGFANVAKNNWNAPVTVSGMVTTSTLTEYTPRTYSGVSISGVVSGEGGFEVRHSGSKYYSPMFRLANENNTFTGGVKLRGISDAKVDLAWLSLAADGALPPTGGALDIEQFGGVMLWTGNIYSLPDIACGGYGVITGECTGAWADVKTPSLTKTGDGTLNLEVALNVTGRTDVTSGGIRFGSASRVPTIATGLKWYHAAPGKNCKGVTSGTTVPTEASLMGVDATGVAAAYSTGSRYWQGSAGGDGAANHQQANLYVGYIRIPGEEGEQVTCNFVSCMVRYAYVVIDGKVVVNMQDNVDKLTNRTTGWDRLCVGQQQTFTAGWKPIFISFGNNWQSGGGPNTDSSSMTKLGWTTNFGLGIDWQGRCVTNVANYVKLQDPGDGSFLRYSLNASDIDPAKYRPTFSGPVAFAGGTTFDLNDAVPYTEYALPDFSGTPTIDNGCVRISGTWKVSAADIAKGPLTVASGAKVVFDANSKLSVSDIGDLRKSSAGHPVIRVENGGVLEGLPSLTGLDDLWRLLPTKDGAGYNLCYLRGLMLVIR